MPGGRGERFAAAAGRQLPLPVMRRLVERLLEAAIERSVLGGRGRQRFRCAAVWRALAAAVHFALLSPELHDRRAIHCFARQIVHHLVLVQSAAVALRTGLLGGGRRRWRWLASTGSGVHAIVAERSRLGDGDARSMHVAVVVVERAALVEVRFEVVRRLVLVLVLEGVLHVVAAGRRVFGGAVERMTFVGQRGFDYAAGGVTEFGACVCPVVVVLLVLLLLVVSGISQTGIWTARFGARQLHGWAAGLLLVRCTTFRETGRHGGRLGGRCR